MVHKSAEAKEVATAIVRGAFEFQGQKCSTLLVLIFHQTFGKKSNILLEDLNSIKIGDPGDLSNFINAVIHEASFDKIASYIDQAKSDIMQRL